VDIALIALLTFSASGVGTLTGFGPSTIMVPVMASFLPLVLVIGRGVAILHTFQT
jgi:hypothetical protein